MESKTKAQNFTKSQKNLKKTYKLGSLFDRSAKKSALKKTSAHDNESNPNRGMTPKNDYVTTKQINITKKNFLTFKVDQTTENISAFKFDNTSNKVSDDKIYNFTDSSMNMTTETTEPAQVSNVVASVSNSTNKTTGDFTYTKTFQTIQLSSDINKVTSDPSSVTTTTNKTTVASTVSPEVPSTTVSANLTRIGNNVLYESDRLNKTTVVYIKTASTTNKTTTPQTTEVSSVNNNVTSYPFAGLYDTTSMTAAKSTTPNMKSVVNNVTKDPDLTELTSSTTATSAVTFTDAVKTTQTTELSFNNNVTDSVSTYVTSKTTYIPSTVTPIKYFFIGGGAITLLFALLMIYFACTRSRKRRKFEFRKKQRENKSVIGLEMGVYEDFKKSFYEKRPFDFEEVDFVENVTEVTVV